MEYASTHDLILDLKRNKEEQNLTIPQIKKMCEEIGAFPSPTTLRRVFRDGSEDDSFNYESTLVPLMRILIKNGSTDDKISMYEHALEYRAEQIELLKAEYEKRSKEYEDRCREYETRMRFLRDQIELKDRRMDEQAQRIDRLMERIDKLTDALMKKL